MAPAEIALMTALAMAVGALHVCVYNRFFTPRFGWLNYPMVCTAAAGLYALRFLVFLEGISYILLSIAGLIICLLLYQCRPAVFIMFHFSLAMLQQLLFCTLAISPWHRKPQSTVTLALFWLMADIVPLLITLMLVRPVAALMKSIDEAAARTALVLPLLSVILFSVVNSMNVMREPNLQQVGLGILASLSAAGIVQIVAIVILHLNRLREDRLRFIRQQLVLQQEHYRSLYGYLSDAVLIRRQARELIRSVSLLVDEGNVAEAISIIEELSLGLGSSSGMLICKNRMVNALLSHKYSAAQRHGIHCSFEVSLAENAGIDDVSLCSVFGNIMDNAIRACSELKTAAPKAISLKCAERAGVLIIKEENPAPPDLIMKAGGAPETTKADKRHHGIGTKVLARVAEQYEGTVDYSINDNNFCVTVMLCIRLD